MRPIKFKGKTTANGHWVYGSLVVYGDGTSAIVNKKSNPWVDPDTIGQFTGLHDRVGSEIYEGDIIELDFPNGRNDIEYVVFDNGRFVSIDPQKPYRKDALYLYLDCVRVIGNIHDIPELKKLIAK